MRNYHVYLIIVLVVHHYQTLKSYEFVYIKCVLIYLYGFIMRM